MATSIGTKVEKFEITKVTFDSNKQLSAIGTCLSCGFERALVTSERFEDEDEAGATCYDENWRCWCPKCDHSYWEGEGRIEKTDTDKLATFLFGRGEYFKEYRRRGNEEMPHRLATNCWICGKELHEGDSIWPQYAHPWFGLHIQCAPKRLATGTSQSSRAL